MLVLESFHILLTFTTNILPSSQVQQILHSVFTQNKSLPENSFYGILFNEISAMLH